MSLHSNAPACNTNIKLRILSRCPDVLDALMYLCCLASGVCSAGTITKTKTSLYANTKSQRGWETERARRTQRDIEGDLVERWRQRFEIDEEKRELSCTGQGGDTSAC